jgi:phosphoglycerate dehydrogenase-like enzyme
MSFVIASQLDESFNAQLRAHSSAPIVIDVPEETPWAAASQADLLVIRPSREWGRIKALARPAEWPGNLKWVYSASVGVDFYPRWLLDAPLVTCGRGVASEEIADYVIAAIYLQTKDLETVRARGPGAWKQAPLGRVAGTTLGIVGLGAIGSAVARRALAARMEVTAARRRSLPSPVRGVRLLDSVAAVVGSADHILLALPATDATRSVIDAAILARAKPGAHLINVARGSVLDQQALLDALDAGALGFATLDVTEPEPLPAGHPLWTHPRVRLTPHVAANYTVVRHALFDKIAADIDAYLRGEIPSDVVDATTGY